MSRSRSDTARAHVPQALWYRRGPGPSGAENPDTTTWCGGLVVKHSRPGYKTLRPLRPHGNRDLTLLAVGWGPRMLIFMIGPVAIDPSPKESRTATIQIPNSEGTYDYYLNPEFRRHPLLDPLPKESRTATIQTPNSKDTARLSSPQTLASGSNKPVAKREPYGHHTNPEFRRHRTAIQPARTSRFRN
ncbi:hypothetical protein BDV96DRAFT_608472 [Lophiotrema nucula]|uniref:Uncharacterized protein n=1 Tax=Lophiotrema nucula TaxID=690887 RepID=A0A6A5YD38_9PLEO|nr:hypothetical protein BDV96DRAFT_608472 [Lophiotrema nucula]